jgi:DNA-binding NarL/FixJ family response regulator
MLTGNTRVYIVDDHAMVRRGVAAMIAAESDMELCGEAEDCATATSEIARLQPDVVVADISLRGNSGLELIKNIRVLNESIRIVVLSVHDESIYALRALKAEAKAYVMKQEISGKVIDAIRKVRKGQMYVSERVGSQMLQRLTKGQEDQGDSPVAGLSDRELEVVTLIGGGLATREIAARLNVSVKTVETHRSHIKTKIHLTTGNQLIQFCVRWVEDSKRLDAIKVSNPPMGPAEPSAPPPAEPSAPPPAGPAGKGRKITSGPFKGRPERRLADVTDRRLNSTTDRRTR